MPRTKVQKKRPSPSDDPLVKSIKTEPEPLWVVIRLMSSTISTFLIQRLISLHLRPWLRLQQLKVLTQVLRIQRLILFGMIQNRFRSLLELVFLRRSTSELSLRHWRYVVDILTMIYMTKSRSSGAGLRMLRIASISGVTSCTRSSTLLRTRMDGVTNLLKIKNKLQWFNLQ